MSWSSSKRVQVRTFKSLCLDCLTRNRTLQLHTSTQSSRRVNMGLRTLSRSPSSNVNLVKPLNQNTLLTTNRERALSPPPPGALSPRVRSPPPKPADPTMPIHAPPPTYHHFLPPHPSPNQPTKPHNHPRPTRPIPRSIPEFPPPPSRLRSYARLPPPSSRRQCVFCC